MAWQNFRAPKLSERMHAKDSPLAGTLRGKSIGEVVRTWQANHPEDFAGVLGHTPLAAIERNAHRMIVIEGRSP